jgi:4-amino-4-deoxy-L-arabinose transferase-like glycosyltransferase
MSTTLLSVASKSSLRVRLRKWIVPALAGLFVIFAAELYLSARLESETFDEPAHLYAGYGYWLHSDFGINPEHPPLVKLVAALPLLRDKPHYPDPVNIFFRFQSAMGGMTMMSAPGAQTILAHARFAVSIFAFALGLLVVLAAREMFGDAAALVALTLFVFDPLILAHGPLIGTDMGATFCIFAAVYAFYRFFKRPSYLRLGVCCLAAGLALAAKHSAILLFPILAMLIVGELLFVRGHESTSKPAIPPLSRWLKGAGVFATILVAAIAILWAFYGFRYAARPAGEQIIPPTDAYIQELHYPVERAVIGFAARHRLLPESYLFGFADVTMLSREGRPMFLLGKRYAEGKWFYFPAAFLIKSTIGFLLLLALLPFARALRQIPFRREAVFLILPPLIFFGAALTSKLNIGIRHILPAMPFLILLAAAGAVALARQSRAWAWAVGVLVALHVASSLHAYPNYLPYSNEAFGGPSRTYRLLEDSNVGWGGGLKALDSELAARNISQCWFAYSALPNPADFQIPCQRIPTFFSALSDRGQQQPVPVHIDGPVFMSSEELDGSYWGPGAMDPYQIFQGLEPSRVIAGEILEFDGSFDLPKVSAISNWVVAVGLMRQGKLDQAIPYAQQAAELDPSSIKAREVLSTAYAAKHRNGDAEREYHAALQEYQSLSAEEKKYVFSPPADPLARH